ncbi:MAG: twitch domain-containing radical SAM protein, partial [Bdellovibrionales bacterium]|nr:twitch domain-containing radical SAM protein [Bdellovibrionales bacterium]
MHKLPISKLRAINAELNEKSPSLCLAKWLQSTIHLQNGFTHSCHHPRPHKISPKEIENDCSSLHNTNEKMLRRKEMLEGYFPTECDYCWSVENAAPENISDRTQKSAEEWSYSRLDEISNLPWDKKINPSYIEVSFGNECNFKCAYCSPTISSSIMHEMEKFGAYSTMPYFSLDKLKDAGEMPIPSHEKNNYVEAFWKWWPSLRKDLKNFRITGGEPLLNPNTFLILDELTRNPIPNLYLSINSNLGVSDTQYRRLLEKIKLFKTSNSSMRFSLYTSVDTFGK